MIYSIIISKQNSEQVWYKDGDNQKQVAAL